MSLNYMDIIIISYSGFALIWYVFYILWQFEIVGGSENGWTKFIRFQDIIETIVFVMSRFIPFGIWGTRALCVAYSIHIIGLILQLVFAEWDGALWKIQTSLWIAFYIIMIFIDIAHIDIISIILNQTIVFIEERAGFIKAIGIGTFIELILFILGKWSEYKKRMQ